MHIQCTKKLLDFFKPEITIKDTDDDLYAWHANFLVNNRKKLLVLMNDLTRYTLVLYGVKKSDFKNVNEWLLPSIYDSMQASGFSHEDIMKYLHNRPKEITYNKTKNRVLVARLNKALKVADWGGSQHGVYSGILQQAHLSEYGNNYLVCEANYKTCYKPKDKLKEYIDLL